MYTRQKVLSFQFLYTGGNNTCRTAKNRRQQKRLKTQDGEGKRRMEQKIKDKEEKHNTRQQKTE